MKQQICNLEDLYILLGRMAEDDRKQRSLLVRMSNGGVFPIVYLTDEKTPNSGLLVLDANTDGKKPFCEGDD